MTNTKEFRNVPSSPSIRIAIHRYYWFGDYRSGLSELIHAMINKEEFRVVPLFLSIRKRITDTISLVIIALVTQN